VVAVADFHQESIVPSIDHKKFNSIVRIIYIKKSKTIAPEKGRP